MNIDVYSILNLLILFLELKYLSPDNDVHYKEIQYFEIRIMQFEWNREKAKKNLRKHKVSFEEAMTVFYDPLSATFEDEEHSINEQRLITIGYSSKNRLLVVAHTEYEKNIRIISARIATAHERKIHES